MTPQILEKDSFHIAGVEGAFIHALSPDRNSHTVIPQLWDQLWEKLKLIPNRVGSAMYGIIFGLPEDRRAHPDELQYIAGVRVESPDTIPDGVDRRTVEGGLYAVFTHKGPPQDISETCRVIYHEWLPTSGFQHAGIADVEVYDERFNCESDDSEFDYWISICPAGSERIEDADQSLNEN